MSYSVHEKEFTWDESKNDWLKRTRRISFEEIILRMAGKDLLDVIEHPAPERYPGQRIFVVRIDEYVVLVPFIEDDRTVSLKTIIPSRKMTKRYLGEKSHGQRN
jgi:mRNA-degrading endonuclease RelE of RelBE toxin-antitoxin system